MPKNDLNVTLKGIDELLFSTEEQRQEEKREQVQQIPIDELHPFTNHPFKVVDDEAMTRTVESIAQFGVLAPLIARPRPDGDGYEIISGHRRQYAAKLAGLETLPVIVRDMDDDAATILMVDSNLQREHISPSERAFAYKMKLDALKNQGARSDLTSRQVVGKLEAADVIGKATDESGRQVQRYVRLTNLIPELLNMVDEKMISFNPAVELSYLSPEQQQEMIKAISLNWKENLPMIKLVHHEMVINSKFLEVPRSYYQRHLNASRVKRIAAEFDERIANAPKVSYRDGHYYVFDGQHTIAARKLLNNNSDLNIVCKVYSGLTEQEEALLFAQQTGISAPLTAGAKLRAKIHGGDPEAIAFQSATQRAGFGLSFNQSHAKWKIACIATAFGEYRQHGERIYTEALRVLAEAWEGDIDSLRSEVLQGVVRFIALYDHESCGTHSALASARTKPT